MKTDRRNICLRTQRHLPALLLAVLVVLPFGADAADRRTSGSADAKINIKNFGKINDNIYRGGQPEGDDFRRLSAFGIKTIVDLRGDFDQNAREAAESAGLRYVNLPLAPKKYPGADAARRFFEIVNDRENGPYYVHCAGGRHRTGAMLAVYRMENDGWNVDQAYEEMKKYDFYTRFGHGCYKDYVFDYGRALQARTPKTGPAASGRAAVVGGQRD